MEKSYYKSPIGILEIICENNKLVSLKLVDYCEKSNFETDFIKDIKNDKNKINYMFLAYNSLSNRKSLEELKNIIKGIELTLE